MPGCGGRSGNAQGSRCSRRSVLPASASALTESRKAVSSPEGSSRATETAPGTRYRTPGRAARSGSGPAAHSPRASRAPHRPSRRGTDGGVDAPQCRADRHGGRRCGRVWAGPGVRSQLNPASPW